MSATSSSSNPPSQAATPGIPDASGLLGGTGFSSRETERRVMSGWPVLALEIVAFLATVAAFVWCANSLDNRSLAPIVGVPLMVLIVLTFIAELVCTNGFLVLQPGMAGVLLLAGAYKGTAKESGFWWVNPFYTKRKLSLRLHTLNSEKLKVNDLSGNPIEIAAVIVWRVADTHAACFEVEDYAGFVETQSESAIRHLANAYPYDSWEDDTAPATTGASAEAHASALADARNLTLRGSIDIVSATLEQELETRLARAGVRVTEARLTHLAYAPEIAEAMLRRQQAGAVIAARTKIVEGAVSMVQMALDQLSARHIVELDDERKAAMVSNLLVVLCSEHNAQPVVNAGTLYG